MLIHLLLGMLAEGRVLFGKPSVGTTFWTSKIGSLVFHWWRLLVQQELHYIYVNKRGLFSAWFQTQGGFQGQDGKFSTISHETLTAAIPVKSSWPLTVIDDNFADWSTVLQYPLELEDPTHVVCLGAWRMKSMKERKWNEINEWMNGRMPSNERIWSCFSQGCRYWSSKWRHSWGVRFF